MAFYCNYGYKGAAINPIKNGGMLGREPSSHRGTYLSYQISQRKRKTMKKELKQARIRTHMMFQDSDDGWRDPFVERSEGI